MAAPGTPFDPVAALMRVVRLGVCARIRYAKGSRPTDITDRIIIPMRLSEGADGLMIRAIQVTPENGMRSFKASRIVLVEPSDVPLGPAAKKAEQFLSGEVKVREQPTKQSAPAGGMSVTISVSMSRNAWMAPWFVEYLGILRGALLDGVLEAEEAAELLRTQDKLGLSYEQICAVHAYLLGQELLSISIDGQVGDEERTYFDGLLSCLSRIGWPIMA